MAAKTLPQAQELKAKEISWVWWCMPIIPAQAEAEGSKVQDLPRVKSQTLSQKAKQPGMMLVSDASRSVASLRAAWST